MKPEPPPLHGFLVVLPSDAATARGWPEAEGAGQAAVWFHGYLAHPARLRAQLGLDSGASEGRIVSAAWRRWRADVTERVVGEYAAVIATGSDAVVVGDRMGLRPCYIANASAGTVVSTDLGVLARETGAWRDPDEQYLADLLAAGIHLGTRTPYRDIRRLGMGETATWSSNRLTVSGGWRPTATPILGTAREHEELLRATVQDAVAGAMPARGGAAVELSGGLDTSTVLAVAARQAPVHALSFVHPGSPGSDETEWIEAALQSTPAQWYPIDATEHEIFAAGPDFGRFLAAPSRRILNWSSSEAEDAVATRLGASTVLTGEGGDAVFLAGLLPWYLADLLRTGRWVRLRKELRAWGVRSDVRRSATFWLRRAAIDGLVRWRERRTLTLHPPRPLSVTAPWLAPEYVGALGLEGRTDRTTSLRVPSVHGQAVLENVVRCAEFARSRQVIPSGTAQVRHPLLAPALVDLALRTPWQVAADPRIDRAVQRYAFAGLVSDTVLRRRSKTIADEAVVNGYRRHPRWQEYLCDSPLVVGRGYVDADGWRNALQSLGRGGGVAQLYSAIQVEVWLRHVNHAGPPVLLSPPGRVPQANDTN